MFIQGRPFLIYLRKTISVRILIPLTFLLLTISCDFSSKKSISKNQQILSESLRIFKQATNDSLTVFERRVLIDSALNFDNLSDSLRTHVLYSKCNIHYLLKEYDSVFIYGERLIKLSEEIQNYGPAGKYYHLLAYYYTKNHPDLEKAYLYHNRAKNQFKLVNDSLQVGRRLISIAAIQQKQNDFFGSKETLTEALGYLEGINNQVYLASAFNELATNHRKLLNNSDAVDYYLKAIKITPSNNNKLRYKNNLATTYIDNKDYNKAIILLESVFKNVSLKKQPIEFARVLDNLTYARWLNLEIKTPEDFKEALDIRKEKSDKRGQISSYTHLGEYYSKNQPLKAEAYLDTVIQLSQELKIPKAETDALQFLMKIKPKNTPLRERYIFLKDSMYTNELRVKTQFAKMKYDDEQEKEQILRLKTETAQKRAELAEQRTQKIILISFISFLLLGGSFLFYLTRQKHKKEKLLEIYNTEKRISRDLHDGLANDVFGVMTKLQNLEIGDDKLLEHLEDIYQTTRQISHENASIRTGEEFKDELYTLIANYQDKKTSILLKGISTINWKMIEEDKCVALHRIIKELLVNMKKHAMASLVSLQFKNSSNKIFITYRDNGIGFNPDISKGIGLKNTENRIISVGGTITFETKQGSGSEIIISMPFSV